MLHHALHNVPRNGADFGQHATAAIFVVAILIFTIALRAEGQLMTEALPDQ